MASDEQRARLLHAALVKASECEKCSWEANETKGCRECLGPHYNTCRLSRTNLGTFNSLNKGASFNDWTLIEAFRSMFSDAAAEAVECHIGEVVVRSRGGGSPDDARPSLSGVRGVSKDLIQGLKESKTAERGREGSKEAEKSEQRPVVENRDGSFLDPMAVLSIAKALCGETGTGWTIIEDGPKRNLPEEESQGPETESAKRPRSNTC